MEALALETPWVTGVAEAAGGSGDPSPVTAYGVLHAMRAAALELDGTPSLDGRRVAVQGAGHVGVHLVRMLVEEGAHVVVADAARAPGVRGRARDRGGRGRARRRDRRAGLRPAGAVRARRCGGRRDGRGRCVAARSAAPPTTSSRATASRTFSSSVGSSTSPTSSPTRAGSSTSRRSSPATRVTRALARAAAIFDTVGRVLATARERRGDPGTRCVAAGPRARRAGRWRPALAAGRPRGVDARRAAADVASRVRVLCRLGEGTVTPRRGWWQHALCL